MKKTDLRTIMTLAWQFVKRNGFALAEALKQAWQVFKLKAKMYRGIVKFYYQKVDGSLREAYGTLNPDLMPVKPDGNDRRLKNPTVQVYFDTEVQDFRCFKLANVLNR
ncbi:MAG: DUF2693 domain-containing protein [Bacteroidales bacterium]|nr:DUF2693 domain-containing protein [Bacteroidales bacterium]